MKEHAMGQARTRSRPARSRKRSPDVVKLTRELRAFKRLLPELLKTHAGLYVAIHHGRLIAADTDDFRLAALVAERARREGAIAICQVVETPDADGECVKGVLWDPYRGIIWDPSFEESSR